MKDKGNEMVEGSMSCRSQWSKKRINAAVVGLQRYEIKNKMCQLVMKFMELKIMKDEPISGMMKSRI